MNANLNEILKNTSRSLYLSIRIMPKPFRELFSLGYLLCRAADSIADTKVVKDELKLKYVLKFPDLLDNENYRKEAFPRLIDAISKDQSLRHEAKLIEHLNDCLVAFDGLEDKKKEIIREVVESVCKGMETDLRYFPTDSKKLKCLENERDLENYCSLIGGGPGAFWAKSLQTCSFAQNADQSWIDIAKDIGSALQITNILRDIAHDIEINRCYIPYGDLNLDNATPSKMPELSEFKKATKKWIYWAIEKLNDSEKFIDKIPKKHFTLRLATIWPIFWCMDTLNEIANADNILDINKKVKISRSKVYWTMLTTSLRGASDKCYLEGLLGRLNCLRYSLSSKE
jgi:farnesyl-diphosphate farnesyltransferase